jgi:hypothetical protein
MSITYGYDLNDGDELMAAPIQANEIVSRVILPGALLVNHLPFRTILYFITAILVFLTAILSAAHSFMGSVSQLRPVDSKGQGAE